MSKPSEFSTEELQLRLDLAKAALLLSKHGVELSRQHQHAIGIGADDKDEGPTFGFNFKTEVSSRSGPWISPERWREAIGPVSERDREKEWYAFCSEPDGKLNVVRLARSPLGMYEASFYQVKRAEEVVALVKPASWVAFDPWRDSQAASLLADSGLNMAEFRFTRSGTTAPMRHICEQLFICRLIHSGDPRLSESIMNVIDDAHRFPSGTCTHFPRRKSGRRIDGALALIMAMGLALDESRQPSGVSQDG